MTLKSRSLSNDCHTILSRKKFAISKYFAHGLFSFRILRVTEFDSDDEITLKKMWNTIENLKRPELVVAVQEWFGVEYLNQNRCEDDDDLVFDGNRSSEDSCHSFDGRGQGNWHKRNISDQSDVSTSELKRNGNSPVRIANKFWYYLFLFGTELGDELFYATMIPFWFWNIDGAVGRRVIFVWSIVMYVGQGLKDVIRWPRPGPPVQRLQSKWSIEYGMPSTHAMVILGDFPLARSRSVLTIDFPQVAVAMPFSVVMYMLDRCANAVARCLSAHSI